MKLLGTIALEDVQAAYTGPECDLWQLIMGAQIHLGGLQSSLHLANRAGIGPGSRGVDLCCCRGAGMCFLVRFRGVAEMTGVDATARIVTDGRQIIDRQGFTGRIQLKQADAVSTGLPADRFDFVWGEDAWCYVVDKAALVREAVRIVRPGGTIAFTDWVEGTTPLSDDEARRLMTFMKFPSLATISDYVRLLETAGCRVECAEDTGRFVPCMNLYMAMLEQQLTYDALAIINFDQAAMEALVTEVTFLQRMACEGKIVQGMFVAKRL